MPKRVEITIASVTKRVIAVPAGEDMAAKGIDCVMVIAAAALSPLAGPLAPHRERSRKHQTCERIAILR